MEIWNRRDFFRQMSYGSAAIALSPAILSACQTGNSAGISNCIDLDGILPVAFINDAAGLILKSNKISGPTVEALTADINLNIPGNMSRISASMPFTDKKIFELLEKIKQYWKDRTPEMKLEHKYSLLLGRILYSDFEANTGELYHQLIGKGYHYDDIRICHDAYILRQISNYSTRTDPRCTVEELSELFQLMLPRMITRLHTFMPDTEDGMKWILDMGQWRKANKDLMRKYAGACLHPEEDHIEKFVNQSGFYSEADKIIQLSRNLINGVQVSPEEISSTLKSDSGNSLYAKCLVKGIKKAELTDLYFTGNLSHGDFTYQMTAM